MWDLIFFFQKAETWWECLTSVNQALCVASHYTSVWLHFSFVIFFLPIPGLLYWRAAPLITPRHRAISTSWPDTRTATECRALPCQEAERHQSASSLGGSDAGQRAARRPYCFYHVCLQQLGADRCLGKRWGSGNRSLSESVQ